MIGDQIDSGFGETSAMNSGSKKQSDEERAAALFAVRVHLPRYVLFW